MNLFWVYLHLNNIFFSWQTLLNYPTIVIVTPTLIHKYVCVCTQGLSSFYMAAISDGCPASDLLDELHTSLTSLLPWLLFQNGHINDDLHTTPYWFLQTCYTLSLRSCWFQRVTVFAHRKSQFNDTSFSLSIEEWKPIQWSILYWFLW